ncbi:AzlC family ABC transporter permease [Lactobacillaceae bacterium Melli_B3]
MTGFLFLGITYGIYMRQEGFNFLYPTLMALTIFGGSIEFVVANLLTHSFAPLTVLGITLLVNSRHLFYGISMLDKYRNTGLAKIYLIFGMCDETFSINYATKLPKEIDQKQFMLYVTLLNHIYWVMGAFLGGVLGSLITIHFKGVSFVMTALFIVLFVDQFLNEKNHFSSFSGIIVSLLALFLVGHNLFLPLTMLIMVVIFSIKRRKGGVK